VLGSLGLYERAEVRDALAHLALLANPADAQAFRRAVQSPRRGVGTATAGRVVAAAREHHGGDLITASADAHTLSGVRSQAVRDRLAAFGTGLEAVRAQWRAGRSLGHIVVATVTLDGGLVAHHQQRRDRSPRAEERRDGERVLEDLRSLCRAAQAFAEQHGSGASLTGFLEHAAGLHAEEVKAGEDRRITVSTIHRAKGTEARLVVLLACEEQLLPSWRALESPDPEDLAEERRLFYVAATRAKDRLVITRAHARGGRPTGGPSRFLAEAGLATQARPLAA
jgi:DNA helicase II / ATP-dependent DNA helicase PcrA